MASTLKVALLCLPISFLATLCYNYFYAVGVKQWPYIILSLIAIGGSIVLSFVINGWWLAQRSYNNIEMLGMALIILGICTTLVAKS